MLHEGVAVFFPFLGKGGRKVVVLDRRFIQNAVAGHLAEFRREWTDGLAQVWFAGPGGVLELVEPLDEEVPPDDDAQQHQEELCQSVDSFAFGPTPLTPTADQEPGEEDDDGRQRQPTEGDWCD